MANEMKGSVHIQKAYSKNFYKERRRRQMANLFISFAVLGNMFAWAVVIVDNYNFSLGNLLAILASLLNILAILLKYFYFDRMEEYEKQL
jgi:hypothetical protein